MIEPQRIEAIGDLVAILWSDGAESYYDMARLRAELPPGVDQLYLPYLFTRTHGVRATHTIAEALGAELG